MNCIMRGKIFADLLLHHLSSGHANDLHITKQSLNHFQNLLSFRVPGVVCRICYLEDLEGNANNIESLLNDF